MCSSNFAFIIPPREKGYGPHPFLVRGCVLHHRYNVQPSGLHTIQKDSINCQNKVIPSSIEVKHCHPEIQRSRDPHIQRSRYPEIQKSTILYFGYDCSPEYIFLFRNFKRLLVGVFFDLVWRDILKCSKAILTKAEYAYQLFCLDIHIYHWMN